MAVANRTTDSSVDDQVLEVVSRLVNELTGGVSRPPNLDDSLDRELGISSLERVELLLRLEQAFGIRLPDSVMAEAATPRDLVTAILRAASAAIEATPTVSEVPTPAALAPTSIPTVARSLVEALRRHADHTPERIHIHLRYIDPIVLMAAIPTQFRFVAKRALGRYPLIGIVIRKAEHLTIEKVGLSDRLAGADEVEQRLRKGERLMIFPEGTSDPAPGLLPFRLGAFRAAVDAGRPIVPIAIDGARHVLPADAWLLRHGSITVTIGAPLEPIAAGWPEMVRLRDQAVEVIRRGCGESAPANEITG